MIARAIKTINSTKGVSLLSIIILLSFLVAGFNAYVFFNPDTPLSRYSFFYFLREYNDNQRKDDIEEIKNAIIQYYDENGELPAPIGWCGRIVSVLNPDVNQEINSHFGDAGVPRDPTFGGTHQDYFYRREDRDTFILLAVLENSPSDSPTYNYEGCHDWPGDDVYNYQVEVSF